MDLKSVRDELDRIVKNQELSASNCLQLIDEITQAITDLQSADDASSTDYKSVIQHLRDKLHGYKYVSNFPELTMGNFIETDISKAHREVKFDSRIVNQIILNQLFHQGLFDVAEIFINESQNPNFISKLHQIRDALKARNLEPAVSWMSANRQKLDKAGSNLEFDLRRLQFLELLEEDKSEAVYFALTYLSPFALKRRNEFIELMSCLWTENIETPPYSDLFSPETWEAVSQELMVQFCGGSIGKSGNDPLAVTVEAGAQALLTFLEFVNVAENREEWAAIWESPVPVELGEEFQFHSIFICPVTWEQTCESNPPVMLPCGHVFCYEAIWDLSNEYTQTFKCPTCRHDDVSVVQCRRLYL